MTSRKMIVTGPGVHVRRAGDKHTVVETILPGQVIEVYEDAGTVDGWEDRVYLDPPRRHVWLDNLAAAPAVDRWLIAAQALEQAFGRDRDTLITMLAIGAAESAQYTLDRGDPAANYPQYAHFACDGYLSFGPWQVFAGVHHQKFIELSGLKTPCEWYQWTHDWANAARIAEYVWRAAGRSFAPWSVFKNGAYQRHLERAAEVVDRLLAGASEPEPPAPEAPPGVADGFDAPVGTLEERAGAKLWPGDWIDAWHPKSGYGQQYKDGAGNISYHTGADFNLNKPGHNSDAGKPVHAAASGIVTWAGKVGNVWLNIIIIEHDPLPGGVRVFTRYAHVDQMQVRAGERVRRGQQIAVVGKSGGVTGNHHLHFDVSPTDVLRGNPGHWPGASLAGVKQHYLDPLEFIGKNRPGPGAAP